MATPTKCACCHEQPAKPGSDVCALCAQGRHTVECKDRSKKNGTTAAGPTPAAPTVQSPPTQPARDAEKPAPAPTSPDAEGETQEITIEDLKAQEGKLMVTSASPEERAASRTIRAGVSGLQLVNLSDYWRFAVAVVKSGAVKGYDTPEKALIAIQFGAEVGLSPMQALQNVATINGRPALHTDAPLAVVMASGECEDFDEWYEHEGQRIQSWPANPKDDTAAFCLAKRKGFKAVVRRFSVADAKTAKLWGKKGKDGQDTPWITYPGRMMLFRARSFSLRDAFPDKLKGFRDEYEVAEIIDVTPAPVPPPKRLSETKAEAPAS